MNDLDTLEIEEKLRLVLSDLGLSAAESSVYIASIKLGLPQTGGILAKRSKLKHSTAYWAINTLKTKGFLSIIPKEGKHRYYLAEPPETLANYLKEKTRKLHVLRKSLETLLPEIEQLKMLSVSAPKVKFFDGLEAVRNLLIKHKLSFREPFLRQSMKYISGEVLIYVIYDGASLSAIEITDKTITENERS